MSTSPTSIDSPNSSRRPSSSHHHHNRQRHRRPSTSSSSAFLNHDPSSARRTSTATSRSSLSKEDAYALYYRSIALFPPPLHSRSTSQAAPPLNDRESDLERPPATSASHQRRSGAQSVVVDPSYLTHLRGRSCTSRPATQLRHDPSSPFSPGTDHDNATYDASTAFPPVTIDYKLPETRQLEYERIDRNSKGVRRLWRKVCPWKESEAGFWEDEDGEADDGADARSVRRFRVDVGED